MNRIHKLLFFLLIFLSSCSPFDPSLLHQYQGAIRAFEKKIFVQFVNVRYCEKEFTLTVTHLAPYIKQLGRNATSINENVDLVVYSPVLSKEVVFTELANQKPHLGETLYAPTDDPGDKEVPVTFVIPFVVIGYYKHLIALSGPGFGGLSGVGIYNQSQKLVGIISMFRSESVWPNFWGQSSIISIGYAISTETIKKFLDEKVCSQ